MRILYLHQHYCTPEGAGGVRSHEFARRWVAGGHRVEVVTGTGYDSTLPLTGMCEIEGIKIRCVGVKYGSKMGFLDRLWAYCLFALKSSWRVCCVQDFDVVLATSTPLTVAVPALCAKWFARKPMVFEVRDVWPDAAIDIGQLKNPLLIGAARFLEKTVYREADHIVPLSPAMQERIRRKGVADRKMTMIPNCCDLEGFAEGNRGRIRQELCSDGKFVILYSGAINEANHIEGLADAIDLLQSSEDWEWWFVGDGNRFEWLAAEKNRRKWKGVKLFGRKPRAAIIHYTAGADCGVVSFDPRPLFYENSPNKFFDYIAASLPVVFNRSTWLSKFIMPLRCALVGSDGDAGELAQNLRQLMVHDDMRAAMSKHARKLAETEFFYGSYAWKYIALLAGCIRPSWQRERVI